MVMLIISKFMNLNGLSLLRFVDSFASIIETVLSFLVSLLANIRFSGQNRRDYSECITKREKTYDGIKENLQQGDFSRILLYCIPNSRHISVSVDSLYKIALKEVCFEMLLLDDFPWQSKL